MLVYDGHVYAVNDSGIAVCWEAKTGRERWRSRLGGQFSSSPVLAGQWIYVSNERGTTFVIAANPEKFDLVAKNQLGDEVFATPAVCDNQLFLRAASPETGVRRETLYCLGEK